jgi:hypothetical protein
MSGEKEVVDISLEPNEKVEKPTMEDIVVENEGEKSPARDIIDPEQGINELKSRLQAEQTRRFEAENRARDAIQRQYRAQSETEDTNYLLIKTAIKTMKRDSNSLKDAFKEALAIGDFERASDIQSKLTEAKMKLEELRKGKDQMKAQRGEAKKAAKMAEQARIPADPVEAFASSLSARSADWVRRNPQYVTNPRLHNKMVAAHHVVVADGVQADTDDYFNAIEEILKPRAAEEPRERVEKRQEGEVDAMSEAAKITQRRSSPPAAPVSRSVSGATRSNVVRLTRAEVEAARDMGMTEKEYAFNKMQLQKEGRI